MTFSPKFLTYEQIMDLQRLQVQEFGGSQGVRDDELLRSALAQPEASFSGKFLHNDQFEMAAAYLFHLVQNHPFIDGNKRIGALAAIVFLDVNGWEITATESAFEALVMEVAQGQMVKPAIADFFRTHSKER